MTKISCNCGNKQEFVSKKGMCIPFTKCSKCGNMIDTKKMCE